MVLLFQTIGGGVPSGPIAPPTINAGGTNGAAPKAEIPAELTLPEGFKNSKKDFEDAYKDLRGCPQFSQFQETPDARVLSDLMEFVSSSRC